MGTNGTGKRNRSWPEALKREIVAASFAPGSSVSKVARHYDVNANQVFGWRKRYRDEAGAPAVRSASQLIPVVVTAEPPAVVPQPSTAAAAIEMILPASTVSASASASKRKRCGACSTYWSGDDPGSVWCAGLAGGRATDMRRGMNGLALQVQKALRGDPHAGDLYVFRGARGDLIKILWHDGLGMSLYAKRLEKGRFIWPSPADGVVGISASQLAYMLDGIDWRNPRTYVSSGSCRIVH